MHAIMARRRGFAVTHLEREPEGRGASVRNFGLVWVSGRRPGPELALALRARELWESIGADAHGAASRPAGSPTIASTEAELAVLREAAGLPDATARVRGAVPWRGARSTPRWPHEFLGGLRCRADAIVELFAHAWRHCASRWPRAVPDMSGCRRARRSSWHPARCATTTATGNWPTLVVLCTGANFTGVAGPHLAASGALASAPGFGGAGLRRVRLQMLQTRPFSGRLATSVADGDFLAALLPRLRCPVAAVTAAQVPVAAENWRAAAHGPAP